MLKKKQESLRKEKSSKDRTTSEIAVIVALPGVNFTKV